MNQRDDAAINQSVERAKLYAAMNIIKIETTDKNLQEIVREIKDIIDE